MQLLERDIKTREVLDWQGLHLIHFAGSTCSQKTRIFLNLKGIQWHSHPLNLMAQDNYKPWFLGINPRGLVPVLVHNGAVHIESNDILLYLEEQFPEPGLIPPDQRDAIVSGLQAEDDLHLDIRTLTMRFVVPTRLARKKPASIASYAKDAGTIGGDRDPHKEVELAFWNDLAREGISDDKARAAAHNFHRVYERLERDLQRTPYLRGDTLSLLDIAWFIYTHRLVAAGYPFGKLHPNTERWYHGLMGREAFAREVAAPMPLRLVSSVLRAAQKMRGTTLADVAGF